MSALVPKAKLVLGNSSAISRTRFLYWAPWQMMMSKPFEAYWRKDSYPCEGGGRGEGRGTGGRSNPASWRKGLPPPVRGRVGERVGVQAGGPSSGQRRGGVPGVAKVV